VDLLLTAPSQVIEAGPGEGEALEKVLARHHADLKRAFAGEAEHPLVGPVEQEVLAQAASLSQTEQLRQAH